MSIGSISDESSKLMSDEQFCQLGKVMLQGMAQMENILFRLVI